MIIYCFKVLETLYGVIVSLCSYAKTGDIYCIIRGLYATDEMLCFVIFFIKILFSFSFVLSINRSELTEAAEYLIQTFYGFESSLVKVTWQTKVSEQYHAYLQIHRQSKDMCMEAIEQYTHTTIQFPKTITDTNGYERKISVIITGSPLYVCQARKLLDVKILFFESLLNFFASFFI